MKTNAIMLKIVALAMVVLVGCTQDQVLASLEASVAATEALVATLQASGKISPAIASEIENAVAGLPSAFRETTAELASSDSTATKSAKIAGYYASTIAALQTLPPDAQAYASAISASIRAFLSGLMPAQALDVSGTGTLTSDARTKLAARNVESENFDAKRLTAIGNRAAALEARLAALKSNVAGPGKAGAQ